MPLARIAAWVVAAAFFSAMAAEGYIYGRADLASFFEDDAFYYIVVARHLAEQGVSTFDGASLTNGYHPLWLALLTVLHAMGLPGPLPIHVLQLLIDAGSVILLYRLIRPSNALSILFVAVAFLFTMFDLGGRGMEVDLLILTFLVFMTLLTGHPPEGRARNLWIGIAGALCIGARIDAAAFILPLLFVGAAPPRDKAWRFLALGVAGAGYLGLNLAVFGLPLPVSGYVKSLGGFHLNTALLGQFRLLIPEADGPLGWVQAALSVVIYERLLWFFWIFIACSYAAIAARGVTRQLLAMFSVGLALFLLKLFFLSSWQIWGWYQFPVTMGLICLLLFLKHDGSPARPERAARALPVLALFLLASYVTLSTFLSIVADVSRSPGAGGSFYEINKRAAAAFRPIFNGARLAMGDRAGSFAYLYGGDVVQLEGLTGDHAYLDALRAGGEITQQLCARDVRFVLAYQRDLGAYSEVEIPVIRPLLSDYAGSPVLRVKAEDEIGRIHDLAIFNTRPPREDGDNYLYAWRLSACPGTPGR